MTAKIACKRISCREVFAHPTLIDAYGKDVNYPDLPGDPDEARYCALEDAGTMRTLGVFVDGVLAGFASYFVYSIPHFKDRTLSTCESIYVEPAYRSKGAGAALIRALLKAAKADGAYGIYLGARVGTDAARVFERIATPMNVLFWRKL